MDEFFPEDTGWVTQDDDVGTRDIGYEQSLTPFQRGYSRGYHEGVTDTRKKVAQMRQLNAVADAYNRKTHRYLNLGFLLAGVVAYPIAISASLLFGFEATLIIWIVGTVLGIPLAVKGNAMKKNALPNYVDPQDLIDFSKKHGIEIKPEGL